MTPMSLNVHTNLAEVENHTRVSMETKQQHKTQTINSSEIKKKPNLKH
jgi:hypothetical protein